MADEANKTGEQRNGGEEQDSESRQGDSLPERTTFWISILLVLSLFVFLGYRAFVAVRPGSANAQPRVVATMRLPQAQRLDATHWSVPVGVQNSGNVALEAVAIRVSYVGADGRAQDTDVMFDYVAEGASEDAFVVVDRAPQTAKITADVASFKTQRKARGY